VAARNSQDLAVCPFAISIALRNAHAAAMGLRGAAQQDHWPTILLGISEAGETVHHAGAGHNHAGGKLKLLKLQIPKGNRMYMRARGGSANVPDARARLGVGRVCAGGWIGLDPAADQHAERPA
jgi:hypothetical protein